MAGDYVKYRRHYRDISGSLIVGTATTTATLQACRGAHWTIYIQRYHVQVTTGSAGKTWTFQDSAGSPVPISGALDASSAPSSYERDFGSVGVPLTEAKDLAFAISAAGAAGVVTWEGYMKLSSTSDLTIADSAQ